MTSQAPKPKVYLITGVSSGFGLTLSLLVLKKGDLVIGTSRNPTSTSSVSSLLQITSLGGTILALNPSGTEAEIKKVAEESVKVHGRIDVLVNNAGYGLLGAVEDIRYQEGQAQFATNFFGPLYLIRALIPHMRQRGSGTIANVSSAQGINGIQTTGLYSASKFALEGLSESLAQELEPFGIRVIIFEPGGFRSEFNANIPREKRKMNEAYKGSMVDIILGSLDQWHKKQAGDVEKGATFMRDVIEGTGVAEGLDLKGSLRVPFGGDCIPQVEGKVKSLQKSLEVLEAVRGWTDVKEGE